MVGTVKADKRQLWALAAASVVRKMGHVAVGVAMGAQAVVAPLLATKATAENLSLAWDITDDPATLTSFNIDVGVQSGGPYFHEIDDVPVNCTEGACQATIEGLPLDTVLFIAVRAISPEGSSAYSGELKGIINSGQDASTANHPMMHWRNISDVPYRHYFTIEAEDGTFFEGLDIGGVTYTGISSEYTPVSGTCAADGTGRNVVTMANGAMRILTISNTGAVTATATYLAGSGATAGYTAVRYARPDTFGPFPSARIFCYNPTLGRAGTQYLSSPSAPIVPITHFANGTVVSPLSSDWAAAELVVFPVNGRSGYIFKKPANGTIRIWDVDPQSGLLMASSAQIAPPSANSIPTRFYIGDGNLLYIDYYDKTNGGKTIVTVGQNLAVSGAPTFVANPLNEIGYLAKADHLKQKVMVAYDKARESYDHGFTYKPGQLAAAFGQNPMGGHAKYFEMAGKAKKTIDRMNLAIRQEEGVKTKRTLARSGALKTRINVPRYRLDG